MTTYYVVETEQSDRWVSSVDMRKQEKWSEHATFMNKLESEGFIVLGGPLQNDSASKESTIHRALLVVEAPDEETVRNRLVEDPWNKNKLLKINFIKRWEILLDRQTVTH